MVTIGWPRAHNGFEFTTRLNDLSWIYGPCFDLKQSYTRANQNYTIMCMCWIKCKWPTLRYKLRSHPDFAYLLRNVDHLHLLPPSFNFKHILELTRHSYLQSNSIQWIQFFLRNIVLNVYRVCPKLHIVTMSYYSTIRLGTVGKPLCRTFFCWLVLLSVILKIYLKSNKLYISFLYNFVLILTEN